METLRYMQSKSGVAATNGLLLTCPPGTGFGQNMSFISTLKNMPSETKINLNSTSSQEI